MRVIIDPKKSLMSVSLFLASRLLITNPIIVFPNLEPIVTFAVSLKLTVQNNG